MMFHTMKYEQGCALGLHLVSKEDCGYNRFGGARARALRNLFSNRVEIEKSSKAQ